MRLRASLAFLALFLVGLAPLAVVAQGGPPLTVQGQQDLQFGQLLGGVVSQVSPDDAGQNAQLRIRGRQNQTLEVAFDLPGALQRPAGGQIPLTFGPSDAHFSASGGTGDRLPFDPTTPWTVTLTQQGWSWIFLGGAALPPAQAPLGEYSATITLTISDLGS